MSRTAEDIRSDMRKLAVEYCALTEPGKRRPGYIPVSGKVIGAEEPDRYRNKVQFPVDEFFPPNSVSPKTATSYQEARSGCCGL